MTTLYLGQIIHCKGINELELITNGFVLVANGQIKDVGTYDKVATIKYLNSKSVQLNEDQFLLPGFIDCHIHASQMPNLGLGLDMGLLDWLQTYTFPLEAEYTNLEFARHVYEKVVSRTLHLGTTCASYFATNDKEATKILADAVEKQGQRAFVGKVSSNCLCPDYYVETTQESINDNIEFISYVLAKKNNLVTPIITPRFALSCDEKLLNELGAIAKKYDLPIQSHISESLGEIEAIKQKFPKSANYASVYDRFNLLTNRCVMAHAVHLEDDEIELLQKRGTSVVHCPNSNLQLSSGLCDVKRILNGGVKVGLGTDVSGGSNASILDAMRTALEVSHSLEFIKKQEIKGSGKISPTTTDNANYTPFTYKEVLYLATLGGAETLGLKGTVGNFEIGKDFDALIIDVGNSEAFDKYTMPQKLVENKTADQILLEKLQKFIYSGDDRNITKVFVQGRQVK